VARLIRYQGCDRGLSIVEYLSQLPFYQKVNQVAERFEREAIANLIFDPGNGRS